MEKTAQVHTICKFMHYYYLDINECEDNNGGCSQLCINTIGSYYCNCNTGYHFIDNSTTICIGRYSCEKYLMCQLCFLDTNECLSNNGGCEQVCTNTNGTFYCTCNHGYNGSEFCSG